MVDKTFIFAKDLWDLLGNNNVVFSSSLEGQQIQISDWETLSTLLKTAIISEATYYGFEEN